MTRRQSITHTYVEFIPKELEAGVLYISKRFNTASHLCYCGCGQKAITPLNPAGWRLTDHGKTVSLSPSIGLGTLPCRSHYFIRQSRIDWCRNMTDDETSWAQQIDRYASQIYTGEITRPQAPTPTLWQRLLAWLRSLWK